MTPELPSSSAISVEHESGRPEDRSPVSETWRNPRLPGRIRELDGIRGLAILLVLVQHYVMDAAIISVPGWKSHILALFRLAWSGVDLFFVLSGFLIGGILIDAKRSENYYQTFYMRRFHRIVPLYCLWLALFCVGVFFFGDAKPQFLFLLFKRNSIPFWTYPLFVQNIAMAFHGGIGPLWLGITWSLAVEEQFYLLLPLAIRRLSIKGILRLVCYAIIAAPLIRIVMLRLGSGPLAPYTLLPCRADALGFGVLVALLVRSKTAWMWLESHRKHIWSVFLLLGAGVFRLLFIKQPFGDPLFVCFGYSLLAAFYAALLLLVIVNPGRIEKLVFGWSPLVKLGIIAYAVYVFHQGVNFLWHGAVFGKIPSVNDWHSILLTVVSLVTVLLLAEISWRVMERPLIGRAHSRYRYSTAPPQERRLLIPAPRFS
jgi:peptidoglycan/LPS O-acetylase OafA/YrhL